MTNIHPDFFNQEREKENAAAAAGGCEVGDNCLGTEALKEMLKPAGDPNRAIQMPASTQALIDGIKSKIAVTTTMIGNLANVEATGQEGGMFGLAQSHANAIHQLGADAGMVPDNMQAALGSSTLIESIENHVKKLIPDDLSKFTENFAQIESAVTQSADAMHNAVQGAKETVSSELGKVAGQFAPMAAGTGTLGASFTNAASQLGTLAGLPLDQSSTSLLESALVSPVVSNAVRDSGIDLDTLTDSQATSILQQVTTPTGISEMKAVLGTTKASGITDGSQFLDFAKASGGAISNSQFSNYVKDFAGDFGALANGNVADLGDVVSGFQNIPANTGFPSGTSKVANDTATEIAGQFGGGSGSNGEIEFADVMGTIMGSTVNADGSTTLSPFEQALKEYQNALSGLGAGSPIDYIGQALTGDWSGVTSSADGGATELTGPGAAGITIANTAANQMSLNATMNMLLPDAIESVSSSGVASAAAKLQSIMEKETANWEKLSLPLSDGPKIVENVQAMTGFVESLPQKFQDPKIKAALNGVLHGSAKALADSAQFGKALQDNVGVAGTNTISPRKA